MKPILASVEPLTAAKRRRYEFDEDIVKVAKKAGGKKAVKLGWGSL